MKGRKTMKQLEEIGIPSTLFPSEFVCPACGKTLKVWIPLTLTGRHFTETEKIIDDYPVEVVLYCPTSMSEKAKTIEELKDIYRDHFKVEFSRQVKFTSMYPPLGRVTYEPSFIGEWTVKSSHK